MARRSRAHAAGDQAAGASSAGDTADVAAQPAQQAPPPVIQVRHLTKSYGHGDATVHALRGPDDPQTGQPLGVSLDIEQGDFVAVMGSSGSGKSTLMNILGCLDIPTGGRYLLDGTDVGHLDETQLSLVRNRKIGFIFQSFNLVPRTTALAQVELPLAYAGVRAAERRKRALAALALVGLSGRADHKPNQLSGGQQQRVAVARALVTAPAMLLADEPTGNLDSRSTEEVLTIIDGLNTTGRTVVLITHEDEVAEHAKRVLRLVDGQIISDVRQGPVAGPPPVLARRLAGRDGAGHPGSGHPSSGHSGSGHPGSGHPGSGHPGSGYSGAAALIGGTAVILWQMIRFACAGLAANKVRSALTMLGVLIGVASVILLLAVGNGSSAAVKNSITSLGTNSLTVTSGASGGARTASTVKKLTVDDARALADPSAAPDIKSVAPVVTTTATADYGDISYTPGSVIGTYPAYFETANEKIASGDYFSNDDVLNSSKVAVIGSTTAQQLFDNVNPVGKTITLGGTPLTVVGVLQTKGATGFSDPDDVVIAPLPTVQNAFTGFSSVSQILVQATSADTTTAAQNEITQILMGTHSLTDPTKLDFRVSNQTSLLTARESTSQTFTVLLGAVAAISLLVGGIGITNIMLVTVTERTREIGIRKALGAPKAVILGQFLAESTLLSVLGAGLGVAVGLFGSHFSVVGIKPVVIPSSVLGAFGIAVAIGLFFGSYPANRAASLRPIDALRHE